MEESREEYSDQNQLPIPQKKRRKSSYQGRKHSRTMLRTLDGEYSLLMNKAHLENRCKIKLDPYSELVPPEETVNRRIFLWSLKQKSYVIQEFQEISSILSGREIKEVFDVLNPYTTRVLNGKKYDPSKPFLFYLSSSCLRHFSLPACRIHRCYLSF